MSFLKRIGSRKKTSVDLSEDTAHAQQQQEKRHAPKGSIHGLSGFRTKVNSSNGASASSPSPSSPSGPGPSHQEGLMSAAEADKLRNRDRKRHKDVTGIMVPAAGPANEYPTFLVHYLGRMPTNSEYGRDAVEEPVEQLCKLREKQKLSRIMVNFNPERLRCWEVGGPFLKTKKDGFSMTVPLHHITYGIGCNNHPNIFACVVRMNAEPAPGEDQMLTLHAFVCAKPEVTQKLTYWQLQAYIEAYEDLKRKRILRERRRKAMGEGPSNVDGPSHGFSPVHEEPQTTPTEITEVKIKGKGMVKVKANVDPGTEQIQNGPSRAVGLVLQDGTADVPAPSNSRVLVLEEELYPSDVFVEPPGATTGTMVQRARIVSRSRVGSCGNSSPPAPVINNNEKSREGSQSSVEGDLKRDNSLQKRIDNLEEFMDMDPNMLKKLMVTEHPTLARRIYHRATVDTEGVFHQLEVDNQGMPDTSDA